MECTMYIVPIQVCSTILMNKFNFVSRHQIVVVKKQNSRREKRELLKGKKSRKSQKKAWLSMIKTSYFCVSCLSGDTHIFEGPSIIFTSKHPNSCHCPTDFKLQGQTQIYLIIQTSQECLLTQQSHLALNSYRHTDRDKIRLINKLKHR